LTGAGALCYNLIMKMTRQHFQALATMVADVTFDADLNHKQEATLTDAVLWVCRQSNSNFDTGRFCDWVDNKVKEKQKSA